jgi:hypothetical protein
MRTNKGRGAPGGSGARWILLIHQIPPKPGYLRVKIGRRLQQIGAVAIKNSVYALPASPRYRAESAEIAREIQELGGECVICEARFVEGLSDEAVEDLFQSARAADFTRLADEAKRLNQSFGPGGSLGKGKRRAVLVALRNLKRRFADAVARDPFDAPGRQGAAGLISLIEDRLQGVDTSRKAVDLRQPPRGAVWVTRTGVMVDRIASAWLIRRFIDSEARFKFVSPRGYRPPRGQLRFDMSGAEFTHQDGRCTFEVLLERFQIRDVALRPIAEMVHDLDLKDARYERPETAGLDRMIIGIALSTQKDGARLEQGAVVFDNLYGYFRKHRTTPPKAPSPVDRDSRARPRRRQPGGQQREGRSP